MNRKVMKTISILLTILMVFTIFAGQVFADNNDATDYLSADIFTGKSNDQTTTSTVTKFIATLINVIQVIGMGVAIIMLIYVAIKYITAAPEGKAEFKKSATAYIVGAIVLFGATGLLGIVKTFVSNNIGA